MTNGEKETLERQFISEWFDEHGEQKMTFADAIEWAFNKDNEEITKLKEQILYLQENQCGCSLANKKTPDIETIKRILEIFFLESEVEELGARDFIENADLIDQVAEDIKKRW